MPNTVAQNLQRLVNAKNAISEAITAKGGTVSTGDGFEEFPADIATIPSGGSGDASKPVRFIDYDGSIVASYTPEEFAELTEMPANPSHEGLTAQGWNWTLSNAKQYVSNYGMLDIGQMYITDDGRTRLYVRIREGRLTPVLLLSLNSNSSLDIDWGDNTSHSTFTSTSSGTYYTRHYYTSAGDYIISIGVTRGSFEFCSYSISSPMSSLLTNSSASLTSPDLTYLNSIRKIEIGDNVTRILHAAFAKCTSLSQITIPNSVTDILDAAFKECYSLSQIIIPSNITTIPTSAFANCRSLSKISIPKSVAAIFGSAFSGCYSLSQITIPNGLSTINDSVFSGCYSLSQITIPSNITTIGASAFSSCYSLSQITIPNGVTSIKQSTFYSCDSLSQITISRGVTSIEKRAFYCCYSLGYIKFASQTPPTVSNSDAWSSIPTDCKILVPRGSLGTYTSATNYPSSSTYTYKEY